MKVKDLIYCGLVEVAGSLIALYIHDKWVAPPVKAEPSTEPCLENPAILDSINQK